MYQPIIEKDLDGAKCTLKCCVQFMVIMNIWIQVKKDNLADSFVSYILTKVCGEPKAEDTENHFTVYRTVCCVL